jgi:hypothetical protein
MRRLAIPFLLTAAVVLQATQVLDACGDKFLLVGRGIKYQRAYAAIYPANILLYAGSKTGRASIMRDAKFQAALKSAGHQITVVENADVVKSAVRSGNFDVILAEITQATGLGTPADLASSKSIVLPVVVDKPTKDQVETCERLFPTCKLKNSGKPLSFLEVIDSAMKVRVKAQAAQKKGS